MALEVQYFDNMKKCLQWLILILIIPIFCILHKFLIWFRILTFKANFGLWNPCFIKSRLVSSSRCLYLYHLMSGKQFWCYKFLQLQVSVYNYSSGLYGLETSKYENHDIFDTKLTPKHQKSILINIFVPLAFEMALVTFVGLLYFSCNPWCLMRPLVQKD